MELWRTRRVSDDPREWVNSHYVSEREDAPSDRSHTGEPHDSTLAWLVVGLVALLLLCCGGFVLSGYGAAMWGLVLLGIRLLWLPLGIACIVLLFVARKPMWAFICFIAILVDVVVILLTAWM